MWTSQHWPPIALLLWYEPDSGQISWLKHCIWAFVTHEYIYSTNKICTNANHWENLYSNPCGKQMCAFSFVQWWTLVLFIAGQESNTEHNCVLPTVYDYISYISTLIIHLSQQCCLTWISLDTHSHAFSHFLFFLSTGPDECKCPFERTIPRQWGAVWYCADDQ